MATKLLKLVSGDDVIAGVESDELQVKLKNPMQVMVTPNGVALMPLMLTAEKRDFIISKSHIMIETDPVKELANEYNVKFGSGLLVP